MQIHRATIIDPETKVFGQAAHSDKYTALLMALFTIYASCTNDNFNNGGYGAIETFSPPTTLDGLEAYITETGYDITWEV